MLNRSRPINPDLPIMGIDDRPLTDKEIYEDAKATIEWLMTHDEYGYPIEPPAEPLRETA